MTGCQHVVSLILGWQTETIAVAVSFQFNEQDGEQDMYKCCGKDPS